MPQEHHQGPHTHINREVSPDQKRHRHRRRNGHPPPNLGRRQIPHQVDGQRRREEAVAQLQAVLGQRRESLHPNNRQIPIYNPKGGLELLIRIAYVERLVEQEEAERRHHAAERRPHRLAHQHRPRRRQR